MEQITMYRSYNGKMYESKEECEAADETYIREDGRKKFLSAFEKLFSAALMDNKYHATGLTCGEYDLFIKRHINKKNVHIHLDAKVGDDMLTFINTTYTEEQVGFCDPSLREYLERCFWNRQDKWIDAAINIFCQIAVELKLECSSLKQ